MPDIVAMGEPRDEPLTLALWTAGVLERWRMVLVTTVLVLAAGLLASVVLPPAYRVTTTFAPNSSSTSKLPISGGSASSLLGLAGQMGVSGLSEPTESPQFYGELMTSRELLTRLLLTKFRDPRSNRVTDSARLVDIMKLRATDTPRRVELGIKALTKSTRVEADPKTNLVSVTFSDRYPTLVASEANAALALVNSFNIQQRSSRARSKREYLERRLAESKADVYRAQAAYRDFLAGNRSWRLSPTLSSEEETLRRNEDVATDLYLSLQKQYESARLDEFNDAALITVVDSAVTPQRPDWPRYTLLIPGAIIGGLLLGVIVAGIATVYADWSRREPLAAMRLRRALRRPGRMDGPVARRA